MTPRSLRSGALASTGLALVYVLVVRWASGSWSHLTDQARGPARGTARLALDGLPEPVDVTWTLEG